MKNIDDLLILGENSNSNQKLICVQNCLETQTIKIKRKKALKWVGQKTKNKSNATIQWKKIILRKSYQL